MPNETSSSYNSLDQFLLQSLFNRRILFLPNEIEVLSANVFVAGLLELQHQKSNDPIKILINSRGGFISDGLMPIYDCMSSLSCQIETICIGEAFSSAAVILAAGTKGYRKAYKHSKMMIHNLSVDDISGTQLEVEQESKRIKVDNKILTDILAKLTGNPISKINIYNS